MAKRKRELEKLLDLVEACMLGRGPLPRTRVETLPLPVKNGALLRQARFLQKVAELEATYGVTTLREMHGKPCVRLVFKPPVRDVDVQLGLEELLVHDMQAYEMAVAAE